MIGVLGLPVRATPVGPASASCSEAVARGRDRDRHQPPAAREQRRLAEQRSLLKAGEVLTERPCVDVVLDRLVQAARSRRRGCGRLLDARARERRSRLPRRRRPARSEVGRRIRPRNRRRCDRRRSPGAETHVRGDRAAAADGVLRRFRGGDRRADHLVRETLGVIGVCSREADRFDEAALRLIEAFASLASVALRNAETYEESTRQAQVERGYRIRRAERAAVRRGDLRRRRPGGGRVARRGLGRRAPQRRRRPRLAGSHGLGSSLTGYLREQAASLTDAARAEAARVAPARGRLEVRRGSCPGRGGRRAALTARDPAHPARGRRAGARACVLPRGDGLRRGPS